MSMQTPFPPAYRPIPQWVPAFLAMMALIAVGAILLYPLVRAWARRIEGRGVDPRFEEELMQLRERVAELEHNGTHVAELEERLDFAERMLAQRSQPRELQRMDTPV
jgi:cytochrome c-type biogenesis protein CcmH/NrfG